MRGGGDCIKSEEALDWIVQVLFCQQIYFGEIQPMPADPLWAPWRMQYILNDLDEDPDLEKPSAEDECFLCRASKTDDWQATYLLDRTDRALAVLNLYPYNNGHLLIAPLDHLARLDEIPAETQTEIMEMITHMTGLLEKLMKPDGFNIGVNLGRVAGAGLPGATSIGMSCPVGTVTQILWPFAAIRTLFHNHWTLYGVWFAPSLKYDRIG